MTDDPGNAPGADQPGPGARARALLHNAAPETAAPGPDAPGPADIVRGFEHSGRPAEFVAIFLRNILFNLLTATIYRFWGKTRVRRYIWSHTDLEGDALEYDGTGLELFTGFAIAILLLGPLALLPAWYFWVSPESDPLDVAMFQSGLSLVLYFLWYIAIYRARQYRLSRTRWRGIRGAMEGSGLGYSLRNLLYTLLTSVTFGLFAPWASVRLWEYEISNSRFGDRGFRFRGDPGELLPTLLVCALLFIPTLGLSWAWYKAAVLRHVAGRTGFEDLRFGFSARGHHLLALVIPNFLLMVLTLGLAYPLVLLRRVRFICRHLSIIGPLQPEALGRCLGPRPRYGEGMADFLGVGGI